MAVRMLTLGVFGINNDSVNTAVNVLILVLVVIWAGAHLLDVRRRPAPHRRPDARRLRDAASLFPFVGTIVYMIVRPPEFLDDVRLRELEMQAAEARLTSFDYQLCPYCDYEVKGDYLRCPSCMRRLKERCYSCGKPIDPAWKLCPFCEAETGAVPPPSARRRRRGGTSSEQAARRPSRRRRPSHVAPRSPPVGTDQNCSALPQAATGARNP